MTDVLSNDLAPPRAGWDAKTDSRTALARSGRDGGILWRTPLDPREDAFSRGEWTESYTFNPLNLLDGDLDGDGAPDILVRREAAGPAIQGQKPSTFPLQALSGRTGRLLWSAGSVGLVPPSGSGPEGWLSIAGIDSRAGDPRGLPDVLVIYEVGFRKTFFINNALMYSTGWHSCQGATAGSAGTSSWPTTRRPG